MILPMCISGCGKHFIVLIVYDHVTRDPYATVMISDFLILTIVKNF